MNDVVLKRFETPDEIRKFELRKFEVLRIGGMTLGRASYVSFCLRQMIRFTLLPAMTVGSCETYVSTHLMGTENYAKGKE